VHTVRRIVAFVLLVALEVAAVVALARLGHRAPFAVAWGALGTWLRSTDPVDAVAALVRLAALAATGWLLAVTLACALVDVVSRRTMPVGLHAHVRRATPRAIRRVVDRALLVAVVGVASLPRVAHAAAPGVRDGRAAPTSVTRALPAPTPAAPSAGVSLTAVAVTVAPGDDLWRLAAARLAATADRSRAELADAEIAPYWLAVCEANRSVVRSGDVNLVYPGEVLVLPAVEPTTR
jgi:nucleoid-associated protein YgaU